MVVIEPLIEPAASARTALQDRQAPAAAGDRGLWAGLGLWRAMAAPRD